MIHLANGVRQQDAPVKGALIRGVFSFPQFYNHTSLPPQRLDGADGGLDHDGVEKPRGLIGRDLQDRRPDTVFAVGLAKFQTRDRLLNFLEGRNHTPVDMVVGSRPLPFKMGVPDQARTLNAARHDLAKVPLPSLPDFNWACRRTAVL